MVKQSLLLGAGVFCALSTSLFAQEIAFENEKDKASYLIGRNIGEQMSADELNLNIELLKTGLGEAVAGKDSQISDEDAQQIMSAFQQEIAEKQNAARAKALEEAKAKYNPDYNRTFSMMRHTSVYTDDSDRQAAMNAVRRVLGQFGNLLMQSGDVVDGFVERVPLESLEGNAFVEPKMLEENLMFGSPETVINKLKRYEALGVDAFIYYASMGLDMAQQRRSLKLFIDEVMPEFA